MKLRMRKQNSTLESGISNAESVLHKAKSKFPTVRVKGAGIKEVDGDYKVAFKANGDPRTRDGVCIYRRIFRMPGKGKLVQQSEVGSLDHDATEGNERKKAIGEKRKQRQTATRMKRFTLCRAQSKTTKVKRIAENSEFYQNRKGA